MLFVQTVNNTHLEKVKRKDQLHSILFNEDNLHKKKTFFEVHVPSLDGRDMPERSSGK